MANPTTNYGFVLPTSSDLVTDLPADFDVALQGVDTRLKALQPGTTLGDLAYSSATANTNTRLPIGTNGQVLAVSGGVPAWTTTSDVTPLTTKGDLFTFTTVDARIGVGANGTVLTADSAEATGLKWATAAAGGLTLLSTTTLTGTSVTVSSISGSYKNLFVYAKNVNTSGNDYVRVRLNGDTGTNYRGSTVELEGATLGGYTGSYNLFSAGTASTNTDFSNKNSSRLTIFRYTDTSLIDYEISAIGYTGSNKYMETNQGRYNASAAITSVTFFTNTGTNTFTNGTLYIYGES
jgi:hypothetical protein